MTFYQVAIKGNKPNGALFESAAAARREIGFLMADDRRYAAEAMEQAGIKVDVTQYEVVEVTR